MNSNETKIGDINPKNGKPFFTPFIEEKVDQSVLDLSKSAEDKIYYVLYYNLEYEEQKWAKFVGRYNAYFGIKNILDSESIDLHASVVLVETVGLDPSTKKGKRYLNHPENSSNIIDFCHYVEKFFGPNAYSVDEYDTGPHIEEEEPESNVQKAFAMNTNPELKEAADMYRAATSGPRSPFTPIFNDDSVESKEI